MTVLAESLSNFGALWNLVAPLGMGLALLQEISPTDVIYSQMLPATLVDCLRHSSGVPSQLMRGPLVLALKGAPHSRVCGHHDSQYKQWVVHARAALLVHVYLSTRQQSAAPPRLGA